jgi:hypothetical protein
MVAGAREPTGIQEKTALVREGLTALTARESARRPAHTSAAAAFLPAHQTTSEEISDHGFSNMRFSIF